MDITRATEDQLYAELAEIDATPHNGNEYTARALMVRAGWIERELERRAEDQED